MKSFNAWLPYVAVSLLYHVVLLVLVTQHLSVTSTDKGQVNTITVELLGKTATIESKPRLQKAKTIAIAKPIQDSVKAEPEKIIISVAEESQTVTATTEQTSSDKQAINTATEDKQSSLDIQPLSKLSRLPAFLRKIEPVYPRAEQRAGSQGYVLAEVTIDEKGNVVDVKIVKGAGKAFDTAVMEALKKSIFVPGYIDKKAVAVRVLVPFRFNLK